MRVSLPQLNKGNQTQFDPPVMPRAMEARGTERATAGSVRIYQQCFLPEYYARLSRPEGCVVITSRMIVSAPLVAGEIAVSSADRPVAIEKHHSAFPRSVCTPPFESLRSRQY